MDLVPDSVELLTILNSIEIEPDFSRRFVFYLQCCRIIGYVLFMTLNILLTAKVFHSIRKCELISPGANCHEGHFI